MTTYRAAIPRAREICPPISLSVAPPFAKVSTPKGRRDSFANGQQAARLSPTTMTSRRDPTLVSRQGKQHGVSRPAIESRENRHLRREQERGDEQNDNQGHARSPPVRISANKNTQVGRRRPRPWGRSSISFATWRQTTHTLTINLVAQFSRRRRFRLRAKAAI